MRSTIVAIGLILIGLPSFAYNLFTCTGRVTDSETGNPISASITYETLPFGNTYGITNTDNEGRYKKIIAKGNVYKITVRAIGYISIEEQIDASSFDSKIAIELEKNYSLKKVKPGQIIANYKIPFHQGLSEVDGKQMAELNELAVYLLNHESMVVQLEGHTDYAGEADRNLELSQDRVEAVKNYLISLGVKPKRIKTIGYGEAKPVIVDRNVANRNDNRRVEVRLLDI